MLLVMGYHHINYIFSLLIPAASTIYLVSRGKKVRRVSSQPDGRFENCWSGRETGQIILIKDEREVTGYLVFIEKVCILGFSSAGFDIFHQTKPCQGFTEAES